MTTKKKILTGTLILSTSGILSHFLGFFYKIYLSDAIGLTEFGILQMLLPVFALSMSICSGGLPIGIQKKVAESIAHNSKEKAHGFLCTGLFITLILSIPLSLLMYCNAPFLAMHLLGKSELTPLLRIISLCFIPSCIHNCINAYFLGCSKTITPSLSQLIEQFAKISSIFLLLRIFEANNIKVSATIGAFGMLFSELIASLFCITIYLFIKGQTRAAKRNTFSPLFSLTLPLSANRIFLHLFQSLEAMLIPSCLCLYGLTYDKAVSIYGMITGMAMSLIMLPSTFVHSFATMLLPEISNANAHNNKNRLNTTCQFTFESCLYIGILFTAEFITFGKNASLILFKNPEIGNYILILAWLCPFMYLSTSFLGIINGLGKTSSTFFISTFCTIVRIIAIWLLTPHFGIKGLLISFLLSQLIMAALCTCYVSKYIPLSFSAVNLILIPGISVYFASSIANLIYKKIPATSLFKLLVAGITLILLYSFLLIGYQYFTSSSRKRTKNSKNNSIHDN